MSHEAKLLILGGVLNLLGFTARMVIQWYFDRKTKVGTHAHKSGKSKAHHKVHESDS